MNALIEDLQSAKSRIAELEHQQASTENNKMQTAQKINLVNVGKLNVPNKNVKSNEEPILKNVSKQNTSFKTHSYERSENDILLCKFCGQSHKRGKNHCPAHGTTCSRCKRLNHFSSTCRKNIGKDSGVPNFQKLSSTPNLQNLRKSRSEPDSKKSKLIVNLEKHSKNHREKDQPPKASNPYYKRKKDFGSLKNPKQPPMYPNGYLDLQRNLLKKLKRRYCEDDYKRSHRLGDGSIWCANHYRLNCNYCCWKSNSDDPHDLTQTKTQDDDVLRFKDVLINMKDQDLQQKRNCDFCSQMSQWKCKHCQKYYCSLYHISIDDPHEAQCLKKQKTFREKTS